MGSGNHDLAPAYRIGPAVAAIVEIYHGAVVGMDDPLKVRQKSPIPSAARMIRPLKPAGDTALASTFGDEIVLTFFAVGAGRTDTPLFRVSETHSVKRF